MRQLMFEDGQTIFAEGDPSTLTFRIIAGSVDICVARTDGSTGRIATLGPDEVFGEMGIIDDGPRSATAIAREPTVCVAYTADEVMALLERDPAQAIDLIRSLIVRLRLANRKLAARPAGAGPPS